MNRKNKSQRAKINAVVRPLALDLLPVIDLRKLEAIADQLREIVLNYNFDTFSFLFELLQMVKTKNVTLLDAFLAFNIKSTELGYKYQGSNCVGLSLLLQTNLQKMGVVTILIPSYGHYLISEEADNYVQVRTADLLGVSRKDGNTPSILFLASGLSIDKVIFITENYTVESSGNLHRIRNVSEKGFEIVTIRPKGDSIIRLFRFEELVNPDESVQKNLLRVRTKYQITRQYKDGRRHFVTFDFSNNLFKVLVRGSKPISMNVKQFRGFVLEEAPHLINIFRNPQLDQYLLLFSDSIELIKEKLLLAEIQNKLT